MRRIHVSSNCQTDGLTEALTVMLPHDCISQSYIPVSAPDVDYLTPIIEQGIDVLVTSDRRCWGSEFKERFATIKVVRVPSIVFPAFHPDIVYAVDATQQLVQCLQADYHSALCLWGWKNSLTPERTIALFSDRSFHALGYLHVWDNSHFALQSRFKEAQLDFSIFWRAIKRQGVFMYSSNHPKIGVLCEVAKQIAIKLGSPESILHEPIHELLTETLDAIRWPVYPTIARHLGTQGSFRWKIRKTKMLSLEQYIHSAFESYQSTLSDPDGIFFHSDGYDDFNKLLLKLTARSA